MVSATIIVLALLVGIPVWIRRLARIPFKWILVPANTVGFIVTDDDPTGEMTQGGGGVVDAKHGVPGKRLDKESSNNPMNWEMVDLGPGEVDPDHRGLLYDTLGVQSFLNPFWKLRTNKLNILRFTKKKGEASYHTQSVEGLHRFVPFSGEMTIVVEDADTKDGLGLKIEMDLIIERTFPVRSVLRLANSNAYLTSYGEEIINSITGQHDAADFFGDEASKLKKALSDALENNDAFRLEVLNQLGFTITEVNTRSVDMPPEHRAIIRKKIEAEKQAEADLILAKNDAQKTREKALGERDAQISRNDADADRIKRVLEPISRNDNMTQIHIVEVGSKAYEENDVVTTYAPGKGGTVPVLPIK